MPQPTVRFTIPLEVKAALTSGVRECLDSTMVEVSTTIEHDLGNASSLCPLRDQRADACRCLAFRQPTQFLLDGAGRREGCARGVIDELRIDACIGAKDGQARTFGGADDPTANTTTTTLPSRSRWR